MSFKPRHNALQNVLCRHDEVSGTAEAGAIVYLSGENKVAKIAASGNVPYAILAQKVKAQAAGLPSNFEFPGELGTSDARLGDPVLLYHSTVAETTHYLLPTGCLAGSALYANLGDGKLTTAVTGVAFGAGSDPIVCAYAQEALTAGEVSAGKALVVKVAL